MKIFLHCHDKLIKFQLVWNKPTTINIKKIKLIRIAGT